MNALDDIGVYVGGGQLIVGACTLICNPVGNLATKWAAWRDLGSGLKVTFSYTLKRICVAARQSYSTPAGVYKMCLDSLGP